jgi:hypothetical protein
LSSEDEKCKDVSIEDLISAAVDAGADIPQRARKIMQTSFAELDSEKHFHAAQKLALKSILTLLSPTLPEVLNFQINDTFVASRLVSKLYCKFTNYVERHNGSINDDIIRLKSSKHYQNPRMISKHYFSVLNQLLKMSASAKERFYESFIVTQVLNEMGKDDPVKLKILSDKLREGAQCSLERLDSLDV